jgi:hypothetical protein
MIANEHKILICAADPDHEQLQKIRGYMSKIENTDPGSIPFSIRKIFAF